MKYGLLDTQENLWIGNDEGPVTYDDPALARLAAEAADVMLGQRRGRIQVREYDEGPKRLRDTLDTTMGPADAIRKLERGEPRDRVRAFLIM